MEYLTVAPLGIPWILTPLFSHPLLCQHGHLETRGVDKDFDDHYRYYHEHFDDHYQNLI